MDADSLRNALRKREEGRGLKNSEITALRQFDRAEIFPSKPRPEPARISEADTRTTLTAGKDTLWQEWQESSSPGGGGYTEGAAVEVVQGIDSKLVKVVTHSTATTPTAFPVILKTIASGVTCLMDGGGIAVENASMDFYVNPAGQTAGIYTATQSIEMDLSGIGDFRIVRTDRTLSVREIDVCVAGVSKTMLVVASDPY